MTKSSRNGARRFMEEYQRAQAHIDELLDEALKQTFPASDPVAINIEPSGPRAKLGQK
jgi:hypothetical protein